MTDEDDENKDLDILTEVFSEFMEEDDSVSVMKEDKLPDLLDLLGLSDDGLRILEELKPTIKEGLINYEDLVEIVIPIMEERRRIETSSVLNEKDQELRRRAKEAFMLFTNGEPDGVITLKHLQRVAAETKDNVQESELRDMLMISGKMEVGFEDFLAIMKQAGGI